MIKRDIPGLMRMYAMAGFFCVAWVLGLVGTIRSIHTFWAQDGLAYHVFDSLVLLCLSLATLLTLFLLIRAQTAWLRLERARHSPDQFPSAHFYPLFVAAFPVPSVNDLQQNNPDAAPFYDLPWLYAHIFQDTEKPLMLKKRMGRRDVLRIIQALLVIFSLVFLVTETLVLAALASSGHREIIVGVALIILLGFVGYAILMSPVIFLITMLEYERIEVNEHGFLRQHGLVRHFIPWDEVRLFAVGGKAGSHYEWFEVSSTKVLIRWPFMPKNAGLLGGPDYTYLMRESPELPYQEVTRSEYLHQLQRMNWYIQQQVDQPLRDLLL